MTNVRKRSGCDSGIIADIVSVTYKMTHKYRGKALIFNNEHFDDINLSPRMGTHMDSERLEKELQRLGFKVREYMDYTKKDILSKIKKTAARDHSEYDCVWIAILSHGKNGYIHARDALYSVEDIWRPFAEDKCPTLAGKPKLFFIQACQGDRTDPGYPLLQPEMMDNETSSFMCCRMPMCKDFLIAFSTLPGFCSWRNTLDGSWFIQSLCEELALKGSSSHLLTLLSCVAGRVAFNFESYNPSNPTMHQKKQITFTMSTLTRILCFPDKSNEEFELDK
ncbi:caspase-like [Drosophila sulfurigaster albostrigata]|uniref:caspase-like n=1 Tax=Drosophila sulfurigaster albostrigata TaxID=89887 RepID=UPI002D21A3F0|nr:caspase-like [Drosophila sulfurigaster albostrigata]